MNPSRVVCFRTDRIGDMIITMPAIAEVKRAFPGCRLCVVCSPKTRELLQGQPWLDDIYAWEARDGQAGLIEYLRRDRPDAALFFYPRFRTALAAFRAGIKIRIGTAYRWYSPLFTRRIRVHRSLNLRHELEYSLDLLKEMGAEIPVMPGLIPPVLGPADEMEGVDSAGCAVVHAGGGGSALNAGAPYWGAVARELESRGIRVLLTGGDAERGLVAEVASAGGLRAERCIFPPGLKALGKILSKARAVVGPATGPVHLAASLGVPVVALYAPLKSQIHRRWAPLGPNSTVLTPHAAVCSKCDRGLCPLFNCLERIAPAQVADAVCRAGEN